MLAVTLSEFGPPSVLRPVELPDPAPGAGQAVVQVAFASITFVETQVRAGRPPNPAMAPELPAVLGNGVGGVVSGRGGYAQRCAVPAAGLIPIPDALAMDEAVALLADGRTAVGLTEMARPQP